MSMGWNEIWCNTYAMEIVKRSHTPSAIEWDDSFSLVVVNCLVYSFNLVCVSYFFLLLFHFVVAAAAVAWYIFYKPSRKWWYIYDYIERKTEQNGMTLLFVFWVSDIHENTIKAHIYAWNTVCEHLCAYACMSWFIHCLPACPPACTWIHLNKAQSFNSSIHLYRIAYMLFVS